MTNLHTFENLMYLCAGCHSGFDERVPVWAFLPVDLDSFITTEEDFQHRRQEAANAGRLLRRPGPPKRTPNIPYRRYQIREGHLFTSVFSNVPVKNWAGSPIAAILRSASIVSGQARLDPVEKCGLPLDVATKFQRLLLLYGNPEPKASTILQRDMSRIHLNNDGADAGGGGSGDTDGGPPGAPKGPHAETPGDKRPPQHIKRARSPGPADTVLTDFDSPPLRKRHRTSAKNDFFYGLNTTSDMLMSWCIDTIENENLASGSGGSGYTSTRTAGVI